MEKAEDLNQIKELLEIVKHKVDMMETGQIGQLASFHYGLKNDLDEVRRDLGEVKDTQEKRMLPSVAYIESSIKVYKS